MRQRSPVLAMPEGASLPRGTTRSVRQPSLRLETAGNGLLAVLDKGCANIQGTCPAPAAWDHRVMVLTRYGPYAARANLRGKEVSRRNASVHQHSSVTFPPRG